MSSNTFIMSSRQSAELDHAFERNGWTADDVKKASGGDLLAKLLLVVRGRAEVVIKSIFTLLRRVSIPAQPAVVTSEEYFTEAGVKSMGNNFKAQFLGLKVFSTKVAELVVRRLEEASLDASILAELGEEAQISVSQFRAFLDANRESSEWFIFYIKGKEGKDGKPWAVRAFWDVDYGGWNVDAISVTDPIRRDQGRQVVSQVQV